MSEYPSISESDSAQRQLQDGRPAAFVQLLVVAGASALGLVFSGLSTSDFVNHLDRQVHSIHCSFIPGAGAELGESGCRTVMMSPYSSVLRGSLWGGIPISLLAMAVFAYLLFRALHFALKPNLNKKDTVFLMAATGLPMGMTLLYGGLALLVIGATCKLCVGVYVTSTVAFVAAVLAHQVTPQPVNQWDPDTGHYGRWFGEGAAFVGAMVALYLITAPQSAKTAKGCGALAHKEDASGVFIPMGRQQGGTPAVAVLDPLCPACKAFDQRLEASGLVDDLNINVVLFPLDATCNWMVKDSMHPGACAVSEAMLCDKDGAQAILAYAFENQEMLRKEAEKDDRALRQRLEKRFPKVKGCLGGATIKNKVNKSLRWAVANALPVLTPQLFVAGRRVCDEDTDLGLEFTVASMLRTGSTQKGRP